LHELSQNGVFWREPECYRHDLPSAKRILIVDDSPTIRRMVRASLAQTGADAFGEAGSGLEAIEQLMLDATALMILDLNMPDMHGLEVLKFVRQHATFRTLPVIVLTTRGDDSSREAAMSAGASAYLTKPFAPQVLAEHARQLLGATIREEGSRAGS
jgi:two-component system, chemotaxis family, chemotaxis protein CheY